MCTTVEAMPLFRVQPPYASRVQTNARRQPVGISLALRDLLDEKVKAELQVADEGLYRDELTIFKRCLEMGQIYRGVFYFGPLAWDWSIDVDDVRIPRWSADTRSNLYLVPTRCWGLEADKVLVTTGRILTVPHPYITSFVKIEDGLCPCLFKTMCPQAKEGLYLRDQSQ